MKCIKSNVLLTVITLMVWCKVNAQPGFGNAIKINDDWQFALNSNDTTTLMPPFSTHWQQVDLPHDWSVRQKLNPKNASCQGFLPGGIGWYKKNIFVAAGKDKVYLYFEGVYNRSEVYVKGHSVGKRPNGYISFMYDITPYVQRNKENEILVTVDHHRNADSRWYTGSGIYRDVWLLYANPVHIKQWGVYAWPKLEGNNGQLNVAVAIDNGSVQETELTVVNELISPSGKMVATDKKTVIVAPGSGSTINMQLSVAAPQLWSLEHPVLYCLKTRILKNGKIIDTTSTRTGFRNFTFDSDNGFALNGQWLKVKGVCIHHDAGVLGAAVYKDVWRRRLQTLKEIGCNAIRTSHNPQAPVIYDLCDELGILVMDEAFDEWEYPKRKWLEGWNVGTPGFEGSYDFFEDWGEKDLADLVQRDRNHLSVFAWSIGNEVDYPNDPYSHSILDGSATSGFTQKIFGGYKKDAPDAMRLGVIAKKLSATVREYDLSRPVTAGLAGVAMSNETEYPAALDITGYNYTESRYNSDHQKYPHRIIYGSENRNDIDAWQTVTHSKHIFGQFLWTGIDYLGESGRWPSRGFYSGLIDFAGFIKPRGYFRQSLWDDKPIVYLGTYLISSGHKKKGTPDDVLSQGSGGNEEKTPSIDAWSSWSYNTDDMVRVVCYTNTQKARLLLNGKEAGVIKDYDNKTGVIYWDIPYKPGQLKVEGLDVSGKAVSTYTINTPGKPYAIKRIDNDYTETAKEIIQVPVQIVDKQGIPVTGAENELTCTISGPGILLGLEGGGNRDMGDYTDNKQKAFRGRLIAYIKRNKKSAPVTITFSAISLKALTVSF